MSNMQAVNELMGKYDDQAIKQAILEAYALGRDDGIEETKGKVYKAVGRYLGIETPATITVSASHPYVTYSDLEQFKQSIIDAELEHVKRVS